MRNETFGRLLKGAISSIAHYEGKTAPLVEEELGQQVGVTGASIQRYKAGHLPPELRTIEILAEAAVTRGYLNREWLQVFLRAAHYQTPERLLDKLFPAAPMRLRPARIYENLPAPTYSQFVMRRQAYDEVVDGLSKRSAAVLIVGLGGTGKTSLAREVAARCLQGDGDRPRFDAVVWVSDKDRPGTTNLSVVLDEIAHTLDYPGLTQFEHEEKRREVEQLLRRQRVLVVVDNFETITDGALLAWLLTLPEPSKALLTTREYRREFRRGGWPIDLRGMTDTEARELVNERLRVLRIEKLVNNQAQLEPLLVATGGNPKAIEITLGLVKYERRPLQQVVDDLYAARGGLFDDLFTRAWMLLDEAARRLLLIMTFFPASASGMALSTSADVQGYAFDRAVERLTELALLDIQYADLNSAPRYLLHPLVRAFAQAKLTEQPKLGADARERWVRWYIDLASMVGYSGDELGRLDLIDLEQDNVYTVIQWCFHNKQFSETIQLANGVGYYYHVRGIWNQKVSVHSMAAESARHLNDLTEEAKSLVYLVQVLSRQDNLAETEKYLSRLQELAKLTPFPEAVQFEYQNALSYYWMAQGHVDKVQQLWEENSNFANPAYHHIITNWLADCLYKKGDLPRAQELYRESLQAATEQNLPRSMVATQIRLIEIDLDKGKLAAAAETLATITPKVYEYQDRQYIALTQISYARLHTMYGNYSAARAALTEALDLFERLGMRRELAEARAVLADMDAGTDAPMMG